MSTRPWAPQPKAGDVVQCRFPEGKVGTPGPAATKLDTDDLLLCLVSGGASSLRSDHQGVKPANLAKLDAAPGFRLAAGNAPRCAVLAWAVAAPLALAVAGVTPASRLAPGAIQVPADTRSLIDVSLSQWIIPAGGAERVRRVDGVLTVDETAEWVLTRAGWGDFALSFEFRVRERPPRIPRTRAAGETHEVVVERERPERAEPYRHGSHSVPAGADHALEQQRPP